MPIGKQFDYAAEALAVHRKKKQAEQPEHAVVAAVIVPPPPQKTKVVRTAKQTLAAVATVSEPRRSARLKAKQLNANGPLHNDDTAIGHVVVVETAAMAAAVASPVLLTPPPPPLVRKSVHWPDVFVYDNERPAPSSLGSLFVTCFILVLVAVNCADDVNSNHRRTGPPAIIRTVIPSEMPLFLPCGGIDEQSIGGEPYEWRSSANSTLAALIPRHNAAASTAVAIRTVIPS
jgi:hypothetical protein